MDDMFALWDEEFPIAPNGPQPTAETNGAKPTVETNCSQLTVETTPSGKKRVDECLSEDPPQKGYGQPARLKGVRATNRKEKHARYYRKNREDILKRKRDQYTANRELRLQQRKAYRERCRDMRNWRISNAEKRRERARNYYRANRERLLKRRWEIKNGLAYTAGALSYSTNLIVAQMRLPTHRIK